jgi:hypothetical protein
VQRRLLREQQQRHRLPVQRCHEPLQLDPDAGVVPRHDDLHAEPGELQLRYGALLT